MRLSPTFPMQTQQKSCFRIQSKRKQHKEFHPVVAAFSAGFPACAHLLSLNTTNNISSRTGCVKHNLSENDIFCGACRPVSAAYGEEVHLCPSSVRRGRCPHRPAGGRWRPPLRCGTFPFSGPRRSPAAGVSFAAGGEAKDLELAATLSRCAPSATGNCSLLRRTCRWPAASLFFGLRSSLLPCCRASALLITSASRN